MSVTWVVKFCEDCSRAFDVEQKPKRTTPLCEECKRERKRANQRRWLTTPSGQRWLESRGRRTRPSRRKCD